MKMQTHIKIKISFGLPPVQKKNSFFSQKTNRIKKVVRTENPFNSQFFVLKNIEKLNLENKNNFQSIKNGVVVVTSIV